MEDLSNDYVLMIEPDKECNKSKESVEDNLTQAMDLLFEKCTFGKKYKGVHRTKCGMSSDNKEWILPDGKITNSLASYYLRYYRHCIPESELDKVRKLAFDYLTFDFKEKEEKLSYNIKKTDNDIIPGDIFPTRQYKYIFSIKQDLDNIDDPSFGLSSYNYDEIKQMLVDQLVDEFKFALNNVVFGDPAGLKINKEEHNE